MSAVWEDGTPKSTNNGFTLGMSGGAMWSKLARNDAMKATSTAAIERARKAGKDRSTIVGLNTRQAPRKPNPTNLPKPLSKTGRMREALKSRPMSSSELADLVNVNRRHCRALLKYDIDKGAVVVLEEYQPVRYALA